MAQADRQGEDEGRRLSPHAEVHFSSRGGEPIYIYCDCVIGATHDYAEWLELPENSRILLRAEQNRGRELQRGQNKIQNAPIS